MRSDSLGSELLCVAGWLRGRLEKEEGRGLGQVFETRTEGHLGTRVERRKWPDSVHV